MEHSIKRWAWLLVLPTFAAFCIAFLIPFFSGLYLSFCNFRTVNDAVFVGLSNYRRIFTADSEFLHALWFTVRFAVLAVLSVNLFGFALALLLTRGIRGTNVFRTFFFMPNLIGGIVLGYIWQMIINGVLYRYQYAITSDPKFGFWGLIILMNWQMIGYVMIIYIAGIQSVPGDLVEAARVDGANAPQVLRHVILPSVMPSVTICLFLTITNSFKMFDQNLALTAGAPANKTRMLALDIYQTFYGRIGYEGVGQAKAVLFFVIVALISLTQLYLTRRKEVEN
ncbi:MAG: sugar ABC transporter permease [Clostridia bacterium]|nr:sugar ABC transporter permease [Clostridia bacterium]